MNAIIVTGGKQYKVSEGDVIYIEKLDNEAGDTVKFEQVLAIIDGEKATFGAPVVEGASVEAKIVKNGKGKKIRIFKYNPKKGYLGQTAESTCQALLTGMMVYFAQLHDEYPEHIEVLEDE